MSQTANPSAEQSPDITEEFSRDTTLSVLSNRRRRFTIHFLKQQQANRATLTDLSDRVAAWENGKAIEDLTPSERKRVRNALRQFHVPKMADEGFVEYNTEAGLVALTDRAARANFYVDSLTGGDVPWGVYYLGFSTLSAVCLLGLWFDITPFDALSPTVYGAFFVTALLVSSVGHVYDNYYRMRLGARSEPPEVNER
jgi:hypothetical protein